jgi:hypothetical protein
MASLWELNPNTSWYLFGDDDTYFLRPAIERKLSHLNSSASVVVGKFWTSWERVTQDVPPLRDEHPFAQGGAGVIISSGMMRRLGPHLRNCSLSYNDPDFAGSMRFAMCAERVVGAEEWSIGKVIVPWADALHSMPPDFEIAQQTVKESPATFHQIRPKMFADLMRAHVAEFRTQGGLNVSIDLGVFTFTKNRIRLGSESNVFEWRVGHWIALEDSTGPMLRAVGNWTVYLDQRNALAGIRQTYEGGVEVICDCDDGITGSRVHFSHFADDVGSRPVMKLDCGKLSYIQTFPRG